MNKKPNLLSAYTLITRRPFSIFHSRSKEIIGILGPRSEFRPAERLSQLIMPMFSFLLPLRYRPIAAEAVAAAMVREAGVHLKGVIRYTYREMMG